jgi:hypothetical protein
MANWYDKTKGEESKRDWEQARELEEDAENATGSTKNTLLNAAEDLRRKSEQEWDEPTTAPTDDTAGEE